MATAGARGGPELSVPAIARTGGGSARSRESGGIVRVEAGDEARAETLGHLFLAGERGWSVGEAAGCRPQRIQRDGESSGQLLLVGRSDAAAPARQFEPQAAERGARKAGGGVEGHQEGAVGGAVCTLHRFHLQLVKTIFRARIWQFRRWLFVEGKPESRNASYILATGGVGTQQASVVRRVPGRRARGGL